MKTARRCVLFFGLLLAAVTVPQAQQATPQAPPEEPVADHKLIRVQVEFIDVAHQQLTELMFGDHTSTNDTELRKKVGELVAKHEATVVETMICTAKCAQKATAESIQEFIYPTEYEPAAVPVSEKTNAAGEKTVAYDKDLATGPTPSAWDTRNVGSTLEVEPNLSADGKLIDLRLVPEIVYNTGNFTWTEWHDQRGNADIKMPLFYTLRINAAVFAVPGQQLLVAALSPKGPDGNTDFTRKVMVFVKCDVFTPGK
jgi:hypothetical protein